MELAYGKKELEQIAKLYGVKGAYKLKKAELIEALLEVIPNKMPEMLPMLDEQDLKLFETLFDGEKVVSENEILDPYYNLMELELVQFIKNKGESKLCVAPVIRETYQNLDLTEIMPKIKRNEQLRKYVISILNLYGLVKLDWAVTLFNKYYEPQTSEKEIIQLVKNDMRLACQSKIIEDYIVEETIYALDKSNFKDFEAETTKKSYFIPGKALLEAYYDETYCETEIQAEGLKAYLLKKYGINSQKADELVTAITMITRVDCGKNGSLMEIIVEEIAELGIEYKSLADINETIKYVVPIINNTRKWINRGFTPAELNPTKVIPQTGQRIKVIDIGRNSPCPCGSGKKYKKCCGR